MGTQEAELLRAVESFHRRLREASAHLVRDAECSRSAATIVRLVAAEPRQVGDLAQLLRVDVSVASRQVAQLVDEGLLERTVDADDRRARVLRLTAAGLERAVAIQQALERRTHDLVAQWSADDVAQAVRVLDRLVDAVDSLGPAPPGRLARAS